MTNIEEIDLPDEPKRGLHLNWIPGVFFRPAATLREIVNQDGAGWITPLLLLMLLLIVAGLVAGPIRTQAAMAAEVQMPDGFQYWDSESQQRFLEASQPNTSPLMMYVFPILGSIAGVWVTWLLTALVVHIVLTLAGSRATRKADFGLTAWSMLPFAVRQVVQIVAMLTTRAAIKSPGVSGLLPADANGGLVFLKSALAFFDLYLVWQAVLLIIGAANGSGLKRGKAALAVVIALLIVLALMALPGFIGAQLTGLGSNGGGIFF